MKKWTEVYKPTDLILYEDINFIVLNKPVGVNVQDDKTGDTSLLRWLENNKKAKLHLVNRIDRPVTGAVLFSRNKTGHQLSQNHKIVEKRYVAITNPISAQAGMLSHFIKKDGRQKKGVISEVAKDGYRTCRLEYEVIHHLDNYDVLSITTFSGRFHQIRAQLAHIGYPIKGDVKYGARRSNKDRSIDLHAYKLKIPNTENEITARPIGREKIWQDLLDFGLL